MGVPSFIDHNARADAWVWSVRDLDGTHACAAARFTHGSPSATAACGKTWGPLDTFELGFDQAERLDCDTCRGRVAAR